MKISDFTPEQLADRWEDHRTVENLMARWFGYTLLRDYESVRGLWCVENEPCLGFNNGYYKGAEAVSGYYDALEAQALAKAQVAKAVYADKLGDTPVEKLMGVGSFEVSTLTAPLIELAGDGKTAKGLWYLYGADVDLEADGPRSEWVFGRIGADFIREAGGWKLWHLLIVEDVRAPFRQKWTEEYALPEADPRFAPIGKVGMPEPNVPCQVMEYFHKRRPLYVIPPLPVRYDSFEDTFSYGV